MPWTTSEPAVRLRSRSHVFDVFAETMDGWRRHLAGRNAALLAFFSFLSLFPLMLAAVSILGFVLEGNAELREDIIDSAAAEIPVLGPQLANNTEAIDGSLLAIIVGLAIALWSSTKAFIGLYGALDDAWEIDVDDRAGMPVQRAKALLGLAVIALSQVVSFFIASFVSAADYPAYGDLTLIVVTVIINILVIAFLYRFLTTKHPTWRDVAPGALLAGVIFTMLQHLGTDLVRRQATGDNEAMVTINVILGLITWLGLIGITVIMCAEFNAARHRLAVEKERRRSEELNLSLRSESVDA